MTHVSKLIYYYLCIGFDHIIRVCNILLGHFLKVLTQIVKIQSYYYLSKDKNFPSTLTKAQGALLNNKWIKKVRFSYKKLVVWLIDSGTLKVLVLGRRKTFPNVSNFYFIAPKTECTSPS